MDGLYRWDIETFRAINVGWHSTVLDPLFLVLSVSGLGGLQALFVLGFYPWRSMRRYVVPGVVAVAFTGFALADVIKHFVKRDRPSNLLDALPQETFYSNSFPSGHTTTAFGLATMLFLMTVGTRRWWMGALALVWAVGVGLSRVYRGVHWPSDALAGACLGAVGAALVYLAFARGGWLDLKLERGAGVA